MAFSEVSTDPAWRPGAVPGSRRDLVMTRQLTGHGRVYLRGALIAEAVPYALRIDSVDVFVFASIELPDAVPHDATLTLVLQDGREVTCTRLGDSDVCVGDGRPLPPATPRDHPVDSRSPRR